MIILLALPVNISSAQKNLAKANTLAYLTAVLLMLAKLFITLPLGANDRNIFTDVIFKYFQ
jgi:hypothetical protein